jgi:hypothetical protein
MVGLITTFPLASARLQNKGGREYLRVQKKPGSNKKQKQMTYHIQANGMNESPKKRLLSTESRGI